MNKINLKETIIYSFFSVRGCFFVRKYEVFFVLQFFVFKGLVRWNKVVYSEGGICYVGGRIALSAREDISGLPV